MRYPALSPQDDSMKERLGGGGSIEVDRSISVISSHEMILSELTYMSSWIHNGKVRQAWTGVGSRRASCLPKKLT